MRRKRKNKKIIPLNVKTLGNDISAYPFVEIEWLDIEGDAGWSNTKIIPTSVIESIKKIK